MEMGYDDIPEDDIQGEEVEHTFSLRSDGLWWCDVDNLPSDFCFDEDRCSNGCVCNVSDPDLRDEHVSLYESVYEYDLKVGRITTAEVLAMALNSAKRAQGEDI